MIVLGIILAVAHDYSIIRHDWVKIQGGDQEYLSKIVMRNEY